MTTTSIASLIVASGLGVMTLLFIFRIVLSWYPEVNLNSLPWNSIAWPTEPFLVVTRKIVPPIGGVDISPVVWVGICSLLREILVGQQGILTMIAAASP